MQFWFINTYLCEYIVYIYIYSLNINQIPIPSTNIMYIVRILIKGFNFKINQNHNSFLNISILFFFKS